MIRKILKIDRLIQGSILFCMISFSLISIFEDGFLFFVLITQFVIGCWQVFSALLLGMLFHFKSRLWYLLAVLLFFAFTMPLYNLSDTGELPLPTAWLNFLWVIVPVSYAILYFILTLKDYRKLSTPSSFWDF